MGARAEVALAGSAVEGLGGRTTSLWSEKASVRGRLLGQVGVDMWEEVLEPRWVALVWTDGGHVAGQEGAVTRCRAGPVGSLGRAQAVVVMEAGRPSGRHPSLLVYLAAQRRLPGLHFPASLAASVLVVSLGPRAPVRSPHETPREDRAWEKQVTALEEAWVSREPGWSTDGQLLGLAG